MKPQHTPLIIWGWLLSTGCAATSPQPTPSTVSGAAMQSFTPTQMFRGRIHLPARSQAIRTQQEYDAFVKQLPTMKVRKGPAEPSDDPLLQKPAVDFTTLMLIAGTCDSFYCSVQIDGYQIADGAMTVYLTRPGEPDGAEMAQRPISAPGGADSVGNYAALMVPRHDGPITFTERR